MSTVELLDDVAVTLVQPPAQAQLPVAASQRALATHGTSPAMLLQIAIERGDGDLDRLERLMRMQKEWQAVEDERAFTAAMAAFKANPPDIVKRKLVEFNDTKYRHADHADVTRPIIEALSPFGISHRWVPEQRDGWVYVTCVLKLGLYEERTMFGAPADPSGKKNPVQAQVSSKTYLERHTLLAACGLTTRDMNDDDGRGAYASTSSGGAAPDPETGETEDPLISAGRNEASKGMKALTAWWSSITAQQRTRITPQFASMRQAARKFDMDGSRR